MTDLLFYKKLVALQKDEHRHHFFRKFDRLDFAAGTQSVLLTGNEYADACKEYPIVFIKTPDNGMISVALLGFRQHENIFLDADGRWNARYIPGYVRRYPFAFSEVENSQQLMMCVDEECENLNTAGEGEPLFDEQGNASPFINNIAQFMQAYQADYLRTREFVERLQQFDLLQENNAKVVLNSGEEFMVSGFSVVDETKLVELEDDKLLQLARTGELGRIYSHLVSLSNFRHFINLEAQRSAAAG